MSISGQIDRIESAKSDLIGSIVAKGVTVPSNATVDQLSALVDQIPSFHSGSFTMSENAQSKSVDIGFEPSNVLVFYSQPDTETTARGVFGWARTDLFSGVVDYIKTATATRTTWSNFTIGNQNQYLAFTENGFNLTPVTSTSPILKGTYNWIAW